MKRGYGFVQSSWIHHVNYISNAEHKRNFWWVRCNVPTNCFLFSGKKKKSNFTVGSLGHTLTRWSKLWSSVSNTWVSCSTSVSEEQATESTAVSWNAQSPSNCKEAWSDYSSKNPSNTSRTYKIEWEFSRAKDALKDRAVKCIPWPKTGSCQGGRNTIKG